MRMRNAGPFGQEGAPIFASLWAAASSTQLPRISGRRPQRATASCARASWISAPARAGWCRAR
ncbi:MAG: hypothetical protein ACK5Y2_06150 [Bdellovibrionales bacterium]